MKVFSLLSLLENVEVFNARGRTKNAHILFRMRLCMSLVHNPISIQVWGLCRLFLHRSFHSLLTDIRAQLRTFLCGNLIIETFNINNFKIQTAMKKLIFVLLVAVACQSCSTVHTTATERDVKAPIVSAVIGDLDVSDQKISFTYEPTKRVRRGGVQNCINSAIALALDEGKYDVLVETQQAIVERKGLFKRKISKVIVTGYPAKYKNFRSADEKAINAGIVTGTLVGQPADKHKSAWWLFDFLK